MARNVLKGWSTVGTYYVYEYAEVQSFFSKESGGEGLLVDFITLVDT